MSQELTAGPNTAGFVGPDGQRVELEAVGYELSSGDRFGANYLNVRFKFVTPADEIFEFVEPGALFVQELDTFANWLTALARDGTQPMVMELDEAGVMVRFQSDPPRVMFEINMDWRGLEELVIVTSADPAALQRTATALRNQLKVFPYRVFPELD
jgi:hypothetical protein